MPIDKITTITGTAVPIPGADIDTDRIIPARFLKCVTFDDLAEGMFYDERFDGDNNNVSKNHPIDAPEFKGASIMVVGPNFGCGSSREHAPQSIKRSGFDAIVGVSYAEIFFGNSTNLGMPCVNVTEAESEFLLKHIKENPSETLQLDLNAMTLQLKDLGKTIPVTMPEGAREALVSGKWDAIQELADNLDKIKQTAASLHYVS